MRDPVHLLTWAFGVLAVTFATIFALLLLLKPDIEGFLYDSLPGRHMPDAFDHLNESVPVFVALSTASLALLSIVTFKKQYLLIVALAAGPIISVLGWLATENFEDPNWSHLVGLGTIGMWVSCMATLWLSCLLRRSRTPVDAAER